MRLPWQRNKPFFTEEEQRCIVDAIRKAERMTSGEVRVYTETKCRYMDALDRAADLFFRFEMDRTEDRNAVLVYVAVKDHQVAVFGDEGIYKKTGEEYWKNEVNRMITSFKKENIAAGICEAVNDIGEALHTYFPFNNDTDKNELPDEIIFGK